MQKNISSYAEHCDCKKPLIIVLAFVLIILFSFLTLSVFVDTVNKIRQGRYIGQDAQSKNTIVVTDTGDIYTKPDLAIINLSVVNEAKTAAEAMADNAEKMNSVIAAVKAKGVEEKDLKTTSYYINPRYEYEKVESNYYIDPNGKRVLIGYEVTQTLEVKIRNLDGIGSIIESATNAGANEVGNLQMTIDNQDQLKQQAREQAISKAKTKAQALASQLGVRLGKITSFSENYYMPYYYSDYAKGMGGAGEAAAPIIQTGENKISVSVVITYEIY